LIFCCNPRNAGITTLQQYCLLIEAANQLILKAHIYCYQLQELHFSLFENYWRDRQKKKKEISEGK
jgi:hypothetical protein